jgi:hypothetical protein
MADEMSGAAEELRRLERAVDLFTAAAPHNRIGNQSTISVNAGGVGVWLAASACAVMLAANLALVAMLISHDRKIDDLRHHLTAIYMLAPHLTPEEP